MKEFLFVLIAFITLNLHSQDTIFIGEFGSDIVPRSQARYYNLVVKDSLSPDLYFENQYDLNNILNRTTTYSNYYSKKRERINFKRYFKNGDLRGEASYTKDKIDGHLVSYWENGKLKRKDLYKKGKFIEGQCWDENGNTIPYYEYFIAPEYPGGIKAFHQYVNNNLDIKQVPHTSIGSKIIISFYIDKDGSISDIELVKGADPLTNLMALKLVAEMPKWSPGIQDGVPVRVKRTLPMRLPERPQPSPTR